jgi:hypothetical protein
LAAPPVFTTLHPRSSVLGADQFRHASGAVLVEAFDTRSMIDELRLAVMRERDARPRVRAQTPRRGFLQVSSEDGPIYGELRTPGAAG